MPASAVLREAPVFAALALSWIYDYCLSSCFVGDASTIHFHLQLDPLASPILDGALGPRAVHSGS